MSDKNAEKELAEFIAKYTPEIQAQANEALTLIRKRLPDANLLVYDNYNALAIGFCPTEKTSEAVFSLALYPRWVSLFFLKKGDELNDPKSLLKGSGKAIRHVVLKSSDDIVSIDIEQLIANSLTINNWIINKESAGKLIIKSISAKQRPRRPKDV
jgi:hypothetical protein